MSGIEPTLPPTMAEEFVLPGERASRQSADPGSGLSSTSSSRSRGKMSGFRARIGLESVARRTLGILLLLTTVMLWTGSNFLASSIFADDSYGKPYFVTYVNTSFFAISLIPIFLRHAYDRGFTAMRRSARGRWQSLFGGYRQKVSQDDQEDRVDHSLSSDSRLLGDDQDEADHERNSLSLDDGKDHSDVVLSVRETARLSLEFCLIWFAANYFVSACLEYTTVASSTILTSTSSIWTLILGAIFGVESFSARKLIGVLASVAGIVLISTVDLSGGNDKDRGSFPHKSTHEVAIGDAMAVLSAVLYGVYTVVMKKRVGNEDRVNMPLFFGLVGFFNVIFLWPGFFILHFTGVEVFAMPPTGRIWAVVLVNSAMSLVSDFCWAYAMLLTTPLVVTVGLSLSIPLSLIGQMVLSAQYSSPLYWVGAGIVVLSFLFINHESTEDENPRGSQISD